MKNFKSAGVDVYQRITDVIIERLNEGVIPWRQPFSTTYVRPRNAQSMRPYNGLNELLLCGFSQPYFLTYQQALQMGGQVKKGAKGIPVVYWNKTYKTADGKSVDPSGITDFEGITVKGFLKYFIVFNIKDIDGLKIVLPEPPVRAEAHSIDMCEQVIDNMANRPLIENGSVACYSPSRDTITIPRIDEFTTSADYYAVLFHELIHSTGHPTRLNREEGMRNKFGSQKYAFEELVAEIGSAYLCADCQIDCKPLEDNTVAYIQNWIEVLSNDTKMIVNASSKSRKAASYISAEQAVAYQD